ncbi:MAG: divalent-cation tolerance protein CutA [Acidobacteriia bacterium]|nr:divalent-cation tolerance protein CutA [Terriglobia bacterium]
MIAGGQNRVVLVTCGSLAEARRIARGVVEARLAACVNIVSAPVESIYRWKGKVERAREFLLVMKTTAKRLRELEREVQRLHSYEVPEFIAVPIVAGSREYLRWLGGSVKGVPR